MFGVDVLKCECGSELKPVSAILKGDEIKRYLRHLGLDADPPEPEEMETEEKKSLSTFLSDDEVKIVWREDSNLDKPPKVGRGKIMNDDDNFVYLSGEKGTVIVNKKDIIAVKQLPK